MKILALESSAVSASAAIWEDGKLLGEFFIHTKQTHSQTLMPMVQQVLACTSTDLHDIDVFAAAAGPGSFTGVRIGVACVKGMAMAEDKPCVGVSTLEAMAQVMTDFRGTVCAVMDARCQQVYHALFQVEGGTVIRQTEDRALSIADLARECAAVSGPVYLVGDGARLCASSEEFQGFCHIRVPEEHLLFQRAWGVAKAAAAAVERNHLQTAAELTPIYLRMPQAERELKQRLSKQQ